MGWTIGGSCGRPSLVLEREQEEKISTADGRFGRIGDSGGLVAMEGMSKHESLVWLLEVSGRGRRRFASTCIVSLT